MNPGLRRTLTLTAFAASGVWICASASVGADGDGWLPALAAAFLVFMHRPVVWRSDPVLPGAAFWIAPCLVFIAGNLTGLVLLQALAWVWAWRRWALADIASAGVPPARSWWAFLFLFPWITHDFPQIGWQFRLSGAAVTGAVFELLGFPVQREGTQLMVGGLPMSVEAACAGMNLLQSLLVVGVVLILLYAPPARRFYLLLACLPVLAWSANTLRMIVITAAGLSAGVEFSRGLFHTWGGLIVVVLMMAVTLPILHLLSPRRPPKEDSA